MSTWIDSEDWIQEKFKELEGKRTEQIVVHLHKEGLQSLGVKTSAAFGRNVEKATQFATEMAKKGYKVLLVSPTEIGFLAWEAWLDGTFHEVKKRR